MIFVDTSGWFARFTPDDPDHNRIKQWFATNTVPLITTDYCVDETHTLLLARRRPQLAMQAGRAFFDESVIHVTYLAREQIERAWILFQQRIDAGWSFTDCTSKIVIEDLKISIGVHTRRALLPIRH